MAEIENKIEYLANVILKEAKLEDRLVRQLLYTMLSAYTQNPVNLAINAPSGEGKSYIINKVADNFPCKDVLILAGMTDKALFHKQGKLVIRNETTGEYEDIEPTIKQMEMEKLEIETNEIMNTKDRKAALFGLEQKRKELFKDAKKLIELQNKIMIFLDTPREQLFDALRPLLSHDKYEVEYEYTDTHSGITTKTNILRGWPAVIFAQAKDASQYKRWPEIQRRFIITNPKMDEDKYRKANELTATKLGVPDLVYQSEIVGDSEKHKARQHVAELKEMILDLTRSDKPGRNNVFIPFNECILSALPSTKAYDMTTNNRFFTYVTLLPVVNASHRPRLKVTLQKDGHFEIIPLAIFEDLRHTTDLMEYANGLRPYISDWYGKVFLPTFQAKKEPDFKITKDKNGEETKKLETIIAVTTEQLIQATYQTYKKKLSIQQLLQVYLYPLLNENYIDKGESELDKRRNIFYPVDLSKSLKLFDVANGNGNGNGNRNGHKVTINKPELFPDKEYLSKRIDHVIALYRKNEYQVDIQAPDGSPIATTKELVESYYSDPDSFFAIKPLSLDEYPQNAEIAKELQKEPAKVEPTS